MRASLALLATTIALLHCGGGTGEAEVAPAAAASAPNLPEGPASRPPEPEAASATAPDAGAPDAGAAAQIPPPPSLTSPFTVGYNEAWFGPSYSSDLTTAFDLAYVETTFDRIRAAGGHVVRLWLFEGFEGIPIGQGSPRVGDVSPTLLANLGKVLAAARARSLAVYLTALDGNALPEEAGPQRDLGWNLLNALYGELDAYEAKVLAPTLAAIAPYQDVIWAFDLMNEIEAPRHRGYWSDPIGGPRAWMKRQVAFVKGKAPWLKVTTSAGHDTAAYDLALGVFSGLGLDFYDLHVYGDDGVVPNAANVCAKAAADGVPMVLGEFGQKSQRDDDALQRSTTKVFLAAAKGSCFKAALPWRFDAAENTWRFLRADGTTRPAVSEMLAVSPP